MDTITRRGRRKGSLRSQLNWAILKTLVFKVAPPLLEERLWEFLDDFLAARLPRRYKPAAFQTYLYRLANDGLIEIEGLKEKRAACLTEKGRRLLEAFEREGKAFDGRVFGAAGRALERAFRKWLAAREPVRPGLLTRLTAEQAEGLRLLPGGIVPEAFVSYDLPHRETVLRQNVLRTLATSGFRRIHQSMYAGPLDRLRDAIETLEPLGALGRMQWGIFVAFCR